MALLACFGLEKYKNKIKSFHWISVFIQTAECLLRSSTINGHATKQEIIRWHCVIIVIRKRKSQRRFYTGGSVGITYFNTASEEIEFRIRKRRI